MLQNALTETREAVHIRRGDLKEDADIKQIINKVYEKPGTDMEDFWMSFLVMTDPLIQNIDACHSRNILEYLSSTYDMLPGVMTYNNHEYGRWLPDYLAMVSSLSEEEIAFFNDHFAQP